MPRVTLLNTGEPTYVAGGMLNLPFVSRPLEVDATWAPHDHLASYHLATVVLLLVSPPNAFTSTSSMEPPQSRLKRKKDSILPDT